LTDREQAGRPGQADGPARDRDPGGRARNARPRDELGRPLPRAAPGPQDVPRIPDDLVVTPAEAAELGGRLLADGHPFHAHEVFEAAWKSTPAPDRELWRGLAQIAVGLTHARRGNDRGAAALLRRGAGHVREHPANDAGVDAAAVAARAEAVAARIERDGLGAVAEPDLRLSLREP
jgi:predicted metal-dependent hydrolase